MPPAIAVVLTLLAVGLEPKAQKEAKAPGHGDHVAFAVAHLSYKGLPSRGPSDATSVQAWMNSGD